MAETPNVHPNLTDQTVKIKARQRNQRLFYRNE